MGNAQSLPVINGNPYPSTLNVAQNKNIKEELGTCVPNKKDNYSATNNFNVLENMFDDIATLKVRVITLLITGYSKNA